MATYTTNYNLNKPTFSELADVRTFNGNMDIIDDVMNASQNSIAEPYDSTKTYNEGDMVMYELYLYRCLDETTGTWDATKWERAYSASSGAGIVYPQDATKYLNGVGQWTVPAGGGDYYSPIIYSTEEREVGVWVDNKPLYQKTFVGSYTLDGDSWYNTGESITNGGVCIKCEAVKTDSNSSDSVCVWGEIDASDGHIEIFNPRNTGSVTANQFTIWYTKTIDTAGSGSYNTLGVPKVHYSTSEQVIGTWIDGSIIYQRTFEFSSPVSVGGSWVNTTIDSTGIDKIIRTVGYHSDGTCYSDICADPTKSNHTVVGIEGYSQGNVSTLMLEYTKL